MLEKFSSFAPTKLFYGPGCRKDIATEAVRFGKRPMLVMDPYFSDSPVGKELRDQLLEVCEHVEVYSDIEPNPVDTSVDEASRICREKECDVIIVVGGGSAIDTAKAISIVAPYGGRCWDYTQRKDAVVRQPEGEGIHLIAVPTTAGTGAETTKFSVISNHDEHAKCTIYQEAIIPDAAFIDPELMLTKPKDLTLYTGIDTFAHAFESLITKRATPYSRIFSEQAIKLFGKSFRRCLDDGSDLDARGDMAWASCLAGIAISHTSTSLPHAFGQTFSGFTGAPHGASIACCLTAVIRWTIPHANEAFAYVARLMDDSLASTPDDKAAIALPDMIDEMLKSVGCAVNFSAFGLNENQVEEFIEQMIIARQSAINNYPKKPTCDDIKELVLKCM